MSQAIRDAIKTLLDGDATFTALIPEARVFAGTKENELTRKKTPAAFDANGAIQRSLLIKRETTTPFGPHDHTARLFITLIFYDHENEGYAGSEAASLRAYQLMHEKSPLTDQPVYWMIRADHLPDQEDPAITNALTIIDRYLLYISIPTS